MNALLVLLACGGKPHEPDAHVYAQVLAAPLDDPEALIARCSTIGDADTRGDCQLYAALQGARHAQLDPETWCEELPEGTWRAECYFLSAEQHRRAGKATHAAGLCQHAGDFADDCGQHLWQTAARSIIFGKGSENLGEHQRKAQKLFLKWKPLLSDGTDYDTRFWKRYYQNAFEPEPTLRIARCEALEDPYRTHCRAAAGDLYLRRIREIVPYEHSRAQFCEASLEALGELPRLAADPDPLLTAVAEEQKQWVCVKGSLERPPPSVALGAELAKVN